MEIIYTEDELSEVVARILELSGSKLLCFYGQMGAGKTTLIKALVKELGGAQKGSSPTFGIVNEYSFEDGSILAYHFDFYRLEDEEEALDIGLEEYLEQDVWIFIEWPEKIDSLIPVDARRFNIEIIDTHVRKISLDS